MATYQVSDLQEAFDAIVGMTNSVTTMNGNSARIIISVPSFLTWEASYLG